MPVIFNGPQHIFNGASRFGLYAGDDLPSGEFGNVRLANDNFCREFYVL